MTKSEYYKELAQYYAASTYLHRVDSVVMLENMSDEWFWRQILEHYRPLRYEFVAGTQGLNSTSISTGCEQCLKYKDYLSQRFFVCIDSDFRYLKSEELYAREGIIQTYAYSWENHCTFVERLNGLKLNFNFADFLLSFSIVVHRGLMFLLHVLKNAGTDFSAKTLRLCLSQQYRKGDEVDNGKTLVKRIENSLEKAMSASAHYASFDYGAMTDEFVLKGVTKENSYLYVRGHNVYDMLNSIGSKLSEGTGIDFEDSVLKSAICYFDYPEMQKVGTDIAQISSLDGISEG
ncbi:MAG: DUF4435 domain-containing protein [Bacteroidaceae bacterium]|nr:DUF4435 domain-containing protein [Bacteroidaceae bacterium]